MNAQGLRLPHPGDVLQSSHGGCNRFAVVNAQAFADGIHLHLQVLYPKDSHLHGRRIDSWFNGLRDEDGLLVSSWAFPKDAYYSALNGPDTTSPRRLEFRVVERANYKRQLDLFGEAA